MNSPSPTSFSFDQPVNTAAVSSLFALFIIFLLQPFGFAYGSTLLQLLIALIISTIPPITYFVAIKLLNHTFKDYTKEWNYKKELAFFFAIIFPGTALLAYSYAFAIYYIYTKRCVGGNALLKAFNYTYSIGLMNYILLKTLDYVFAFKSQLNNKKSDNQNISTRTITIISNNHKNFLTVEPKDIKFIESMGNDVKIHYFTDNKRTQTVMRKSLTELEKQLSEYPFFFRIHRSFLINIELISSVEGNSNKSFAILHSGKEIPVSRQKFQLLRNKISNN